MKHSIKRVQSQAGLSFAERKNVRPSVKQKLLLLLVLLMTAATNTWAVPYRLYLDVSGTSATLKYGSYDGKPSYISGGWDAIGDVRTTVQTITTDATSCANFSGTTLKSLFDQFTALTSVDLSGLNTANVTNMAYLFNSCSSLTSFNLSGLNTDKVTAMNALFNGCTSLTSVDLSGLNTANVTDMTALFGGCTSLTSVDLSGLNTSKVTNMASMFNICSSLTSVDLSNWDTSSATSMGSMFSGCSALTSVNLSSFNTSNVTIMGGMFNSCSSLTTLDLSSFNTSKVTSMSNMFYSCTNLTTIYVGNDWSTDAVTNSNNMFKFCTKLPNFNSSKLDRTNAHTGEGGYLSTKPYKVTLNDTKDAANWTITPAEATTTGVSKGKTVTLTYTGRMKVKNVTATTDAVPPAPPAEGHALAKSAVGELVGNDGKAYAAADKDNLPSGVTAVALVCYKNGSKGLALALADEGQMNCSTAISTCEGKTPTVTGCTWKLATKDEWDNMISGAGGYAALRDGFTSVGGTNLKSNWYWSSRKYNDSYTYEYFFGEGRMSNWSWANKDTSIYVRAALAF